MDENDRTAREDHAHTEQKGAEQDGHHAEHPHFGDHSATHGSHVRTTHDDARVEHGSHATHGTYSKQDSHVEHGSRAEHDPHAQHDPHAEHGTHAGHDAHAGHNVEQFRDKFWISLLLTIPTLVWGHMLQAGFGYAAPQFSGARWIAPICGTAVFFYGGWVFLRGALQELRHRVPGMMTLIGLAITVSFVFSVAVTLGYPGMPLWDELATLVTIMLLGHWMEMRSIAQARGAVDELAKLLPATATRIVHDGSAERFEDVPVGDLAEGDFILVRPGTSFPADGVIREGRGAVNESMITGESRPVEKAAGAPVIAGTVNGTSALRVEVTGVGEHTALSGIMRLVREAQSSRSHAQSLADRAAFVLTIIAVVVGVATWLVWLSIGAGSAYAVERTVSVLVIACPHALGLAIPLVIAISTTLAAQRGLLIRNRRGFEDAWRLTTVVFDKTGTLTLGEFRVVDITPSDAVSNVEALRLAASVERASEHTIARSIVQTAEDRQLTFSAAGDVVALPGHGIRAVVDGRRLLVGGPALLREQRVTLDTAAQAAVDRASGQGQTAVALLEEIDATNGTTPPKILAIFAIADALRPESRDAVRALQASGIDVVMMTGDAKPVADSVAHELGINSVFAEVLPEDKAKTVASLQQPRQDGRTPRVAMVGDGVNDAPALVTADVGIAIGAGTDVAVEAGDVVLVRSDPRDVPALIDLSARSYRKMVQNLWWATGYNVVAIPLAAGVLAPWGIVLPPAAAAVLMSLSTVIVAANAQLLRRVGSALRG